MPDIVPAELGVRDPAHRDDAPPAGELTGKRKPGLDLCSARPPVRPFVPGMGRDDVPEQHAVGEAELLEAA
jgi:hypothetical protein